MRKLVFMLSMIALGVRAQTNVAITNATSYSGGAVITNLFDGNYSTAITYTTKVYPNVGVYFDVPVDLDSIVIHFINQKASAQRITMEIRVLENGVWSAPVKTINYMPTSGLDEKYKIDLDLVAVTGIKVQTTSVFNNLDHPDWTEVEMYGMPSITTSVVEDLEVRDEVLGVYNMDGEFVEVDSKGLVIIKWKSGKTEKIFNY